VRTETLSRLLLSSEQMLKDVAEEILCPSKRPKHAPCLHTQIISGRGRER